MTTAPAQPLSTSLERSFKKLGDERLQALGRELTERARARGLVVVRDAGPVDIPSTLTPELVSPEVEASRARDAAVVLDGVVRVARIILREGPKSALAQRLFGHFGPLEQVGLEQWERAEDVTIARVDWFVDASGRHYALELNATIPAMQAYSDAAAGAWIETIGREAGLGDEQIARLVQTNGSNAEALRRSIVAHADTAAPSPSIAVVHRENDPQIRELEALRRRFAGGGNETWLATPAEVALDGDTVIVQGRRPDILFRHIFARRIPEGSALEAIARGRGMRMQNPVNGQLEVKGLLAELSRHVQEDGGASLGLSEASRQVLARVVPWTRLLCTERCLSPDGTPTEIIALVESEPERFVLKRSWDYGGKSVLLGREVLATEGREGWVRRVRTAAADGPGTWVVQQFVDSPRRRHLVLGEQGAAWEEVYVDASTYTASGERDVPGGGVARFARSGIVNIVGGGGVAPLVRTDVAQTLVEALARRVG